jgi:hypothetical protein
MWRAEVSLMLATPDHPPGLPRVALDEAEAPRVAGLVSAYKESLAPIDCGSGELTHRTTRAK